MAGGETTTIVLADTSVVVNLAIVDRLDLLGALEGFRFRVPSEVVAEVRRPRQWDLLEKALRDGHLDRVELTGIAGLDHYRKLRHELGLGRGESACLALASTRGWMIASDEKRRFLREARRLLGNDRLLNTPGLFILGIEEDYWTVSDADRAKEILERNRFRMRFRSFHDVIRRKVT